eukprot:scaffold257934_cov26-Tisochrysis_lutea.AAC.2
MQPRSWLILAEVSPCRRPGSTPAKAREGSGCWRPHRGRNMCPRSRTGRVAPVAGLPSRGYERGGTNNR